MWASRPKQSPVFLGSDGALSMRIESAKNSIGSQISYLGSKFTVELGS
jgi:hypothetical protein